MEDSTTQGAWGHVHKMKEHLAHAQQNWTTKGTLGDSEDATLLAKYQVRITQVCVPDGKSGHTFSQNSKTISEVPRSLDTFCKVPFRFRGDLHYDCLADAENDRWCPQQVGEEDKVAVGQWRQCFSTTCSISGTDHECMSTKFHVLWLMSYDSYEIAFLFQKQLIAYAWRKRISNASSLLHWMVPITMSAWRTAHLMLPGMGGALHSWMIRGNPQIGKCARLTAKLLVGDSSENFPMY